MFIFRNDDLVHLFVQLRLQNTGEVRVFLYSTIFNLDVSKHIIAAHLHDEQRLCRATNLQSAFYGELVVTNHETLFDDGFGGSVPICDFAERMRSTEVMKPYSVPPAMIPF
jgi:hypothetical protein